MAFLSDWTYRRKIIIDSTKIDSTLSHFPVTLKLSTSSGYDSQDISSIFDELGANSKKIAITQSDGITQLYAEIELWDAINEIAIIHISKSGWTISNSSDTEIYFYYDSTKSDNTSYISDTPGDSIVANVWDSDFKLIYHMNQDPSGTAPQVKDSSGNSNDGTSSGSMTSGDLVDGAIGKAITFDGVNDKLTINDASELRLSGDITFESYVNWTSVGANHDTFIEKGTHDSNGINYLFGWKSDQKLKFTYSDGAFQNIADTSGFIPSTAVDYYIAISCNKSTNNVKFYVDDILKSTVNDPNNLNYPTNTENLSIGTNTATSEQFDGILDEIRLSSVLRSDAWLKATYHSLHDSLVSWQVEETNLQIIETETIVLSDDFNSNFTDDIDSLGFVETLVVKPSLEKIELSEILSLTESSEESTIIDSAIRILYDSPSTLYIITYTDPVKLIKVTIGSGDVPSFSSYTLNASGEDFKNAYDIALNSTFGYIYITGANGQIMKINLSDLNDREQIDLQDTDNLLLVDTYDIFNKLYASTSDTDGEIITLDESQIAVLSSDFRFNRQVNYFLSSVINIIKGSLVNTFFAFLNNQTKAIGSDIRFSVTDPSQNIEGMGRTDWHVYIDDAETADVAIDSITVDYNIEEEFSQARFTLGRYHDNPNKTYEGVSSEITNNNRVTIKLDDKIIFDGKIANLEFLGSREQIVVTSVATPATVNEYTPSGTYSYSWLAIRNYYKKLDLIDTETEINGDDNELLYDKLTTARNELKSNTVELPLASITKQRHLYEVILNDITMNKTPIDPNSRTPSKYNGVKIDTGFVEFEWVWITHSSADEASGSLIAPFGGNGGNDPLVLGGELNGSLGNTASLVELINNGLFQPIPDYTYFWIVSAFKYENIQLYNDDGTPQTDINGQIATTTVRREFFSRYIGTSLDSLTSDNWIITEASYWRQRVDNNWILPSRGWKNPEVQDIDSDTAVRNRPGETALLEPETFYYLGSEPYKEIAGERGAYKSKRMYVDREDGLYIEKRASYDYTGTYAEQLAELELNKLKNINGDLNQDVSAQIELSLDAYLYYNLGLLTKINITNTTESGVFKNNNGFPLSIKSINLDSNNMICTLAVDNQKCSLESDILDSSAPDPEDFSTEDYYHKLETKYNPATGRTVE